METIPNEILNEILLKVDHVSLLSTSRVCSLWDRLSLKQVVKVETEESFKRACRRGDLFSLVHSKDWKDEWLKGELFETCRGGHLDLAEWAVQKGAKNWNWALRGACRGGHLALAEWAVQKGANNWNWALYDACQEGHLALAEWLVQKGANDWNGALFGACRGGHLALAEWAVQKGANNWDGTLYGACMEKEKNMIKWAIEKGATTCHWCMNPIQEH